MTKILILILLSHPLYAEPLIRLDTVKTEDTNLQDFKIALHITENCSICDRQIAILKDCVLPVKTGVFMEGDNEEIMRKIVRKKKIGMSVFNLTAEIKKYYAFNIKTPTIAIQTKMGLKTHEGLMECQAIKSQL